MNDDVVNLYDCDSCGYRYNPKHFHGVDLDDQPQDFECPSCQAGRDHFHLHKPPADDVAPLLGDDDGAPAYMDPFGPKPLVVDEASPTLETLFIQYAKKDLDTQPDFQRYEVWSTQKNSALVESALIGLPIPPVYLAEEDDGRYVVIDGQQRLMAIFRYMNNSYALKDVAKPLAVKYAALDPVLRRRLDNYPLRVIRIRQESDPDARFTLFKRLNEGATSLNDQELRNCVRRGEFNEFVKRLAEDSSWRKLLNLTKRHPRMTDVELVLRYLAFKDQTYMKHADKKTGAFLDGQMVRGRAWKEKDYKLAEKDFKTSLAIAETVFGDHAGRRFVPGDDKHPQGGWDSKLNRALMDVELWGFNRYSRGLFTKNRDAIREAAVELMSSHEFSDLIKHSISDKTRVERRFDLWKQMLDTVLKDEDLGPRLFSRQEKEAAFKEDPTCGACLQKISSLDDAHLDHVLPYTKGGPTEPANRALLHRYCNLAKSDREAAPRSALDE